jgi:hypothetical protein
VGVVTSAAGGGPLGAAISLDTISWRLGGVGDQWQQPGATSSASGTLFSVANHRPGIAGSSPGDNSKRPTWLFKSRCLSW